MRYESDSLCRTSWLGIPILEANGLTAVFRNLTGNCGMLIGGFFEIFFGAKWNSLLAGFFKGDRGVKITPRILGVTPRFGSAAAA